MDKTHFQEICNKVAVLDNSLKKIIRKYGYPPFWSRPNTYESLVQIILEQQVSLASAKAAYVMLKSLISDVNPDTILALNDEQLRSAYFSRQKIGYVRELASEIQGGLSLNDLAHMTDEAIRERLLMVKGIGNWTVDVYLIEVLHRSDIFPSGDIAALRAMKEIKNLNSMNKDDAIEIAESWRPYRTAATMLLWHHYLASRDRSEEMLAGV